jgi:hypothetical protein
MEAADIYQILPFWMASFRSFPEYEAEMPASRFHG